MDLLRLIDSKIFYFLHSFAGHSVFFDRVIVFFAEYFQYIVLILFICFIYSFSSQIKEKFIIILTTALSPLISYTVVITLIRMMYNRPRPFVQQNFIPLFNESSFSFPSGHAIFFFSLAFAIYFYDKTWGKWFLVFASLIGIARIAAGVHFPSDIAAGIVLGYFVSLVIFRLITPVLKRHIEQSDKIAKKL